MGGELSSNNDLQSIIGTIKRVNERGIFMEEIKKVLEEKQLNINIIGLDETNIENIYKLFL